MNAQANIILDPETQRRAEAKAAARGMTFADYVATLIAHDIDGSTTAKSDDNGHSIPFDVSELFDLGCSAQPTDIARDKDRLVAEAAWQEHLRKTRQQTPDQ